MTDRVDQTPLHEGDHVRHCEFQSPNAVGVVTAVYPRSHQADVVWPWSHGADDAALMEITDLRKVDLEGARRDG